MAERDASQCYIKVSVLMGLGQGMNGSEGGQELGPGWGSVIQHTCAGPGLCAAPGAGLCAAMGSRLQPGGS